MSVASLLNIWQNDTQTGRNFTAWETLPSRSADLRKFPSDLPAVLGSILSSMGINELYGHQVDAWNAVRTGKNVALATGTASGKTLSYQLPVLAKAVEKSDSCALFLFPTKALAQDQLTSLLQFQMYLKDLSAAIYDGDTQTSRRRSIREKSRIVLTNPDMLHTGILPHHANWSVFFSNLELVVIDEMHAYRGIFGSHVANVLRRLKRITRFYGSEPRFLLTSATIGNPAELAEKLIGEPVHLIDQDGSARGPRHFLFYNPPVIDESIGLRRSALQEGVRLAWDAYEEGLQQVIFTGSRRSVEIILKSLLEHLLWTQRKNKLEEIRGYRSGYLPSQRRVIETGLRNGNVKVVVATNALELGIDIGGLEIAMLVGYPGTIASARQQAGRAGRGLDPAVAILIASANPVDQFLAHHPAYFFDRSPEQALIAPEHLLILLDHLRCAMFELPFQVGEKYAGLSVDEYMKFLVENEEAHFSQGHFYWMTDAYPAAKISLRSVSPESFILQAIGEGERSVSSRETSGVIGVVDGQSAMWMVHPGAVYLHEARQYIVEDLNLDQKVAWLRLFEGDYFTEPIRRTSLSIVSISEQEDFLETGNSSIIHSKGWGEMQVTTQVTGYRKLKWSTRENLGEDTLVLPPIDLLTTGYWISIPAGIINQLASSGLWRNSPNEYGPDWNRLRESVRKRDGYSCKVCGRLEGARQHDVHHKVPFRMFRDEPGIPIWERANELSNLITLCHDCHTQVEMNVRVRSGLAGLTYILRNLAPLFLMCDPNDLGGHFEPVGSGSFSQPSVVLYELIPAGIGFSQKLFEIHVELIHRAYELVDACACEDGCPSCVGPGGENGLGGKMETKGLLNLLIGEGSFLGGREKDSSV